jgi:hypothetical protein
VHFHPCTFCTITKLFRKRVWRKWSRENSIQAVGAPETFQFPVCRPSEVTLQGAKSRLAHPKLSIRVFKGEAKQLLS